MPSFDDIVQLVREQTCFRGPLTASTTLQRDLGVYGIDMDYLLVAYADRFGVDMSAYRWYFHTGEEGLNIGALFFRPPNAVVSEIAITLEMLHEFANNGVWAVSYPPHPEARFRGDILVNQALAGVFFLFLVSYALAWLVGWSR
jgi:hypothetical protein